MSTDDKLLGEPPRRGRRKGQASKAEEALRTMRPEGHALVAALGADFVDRRVELLDCLCAADYCPDRSPSRIPTELVGLAWRMLRALKRNDDAWFRRLLAVRSGKAYEQLANAGGSAPLASYAEPDRAVLAHLVAQQIAGTKGPLSDQEISDEVASAQAEDDGTPTPTTKTLGKKFLEIGGVKNRTRGRKSSKRK